VSHTGKLVARIAALAFVALGAGIASADEPVDLQATITALDSEVFDAFNHCADPAQLAKHAGYFSPKVEFYHDTGGVTWDRKSMLANTKKYVCGNYRRELIPGSLRVYPVKGFGAIAQGTHRFCSFADDKCEGLADFAIVWQHTKDKWQITRVLSYGHRPNVPDGAAAN
jgi:hypothetical protein